MKNFFKGVIQDVLPKAYRRFLNGVEKKPGLSENHVQNAIFSKELFMFCTLRSTIIYTF